jgi:hypothetical protein
MQHPTGRRVLGLVAALAFATAGSAFAQDTTETGRAAIDTSEPGAGAIDTTVADTSDTSAVTDTSAVRDTTDTSGVQNPPGYRGMERDTTMFPPEEGAQQAPQEAEDQTTGTYEDTAAGDTSGARENDAYREERPAAADTAAAGHDTTHQSGAGVGDTNTPTPDSAQ